MRRTRTIRSLGHWRSLRWKVAALVAVAVCAVAAGIGVLVHQATYARALSQARDTAQRQLDLATTAYSRTGSTQGTEGRLDASEVPEDLSELVRRGHDGTAFGRNRYGPVMWAARPVGARMLCVDVDMRADLRNLKLLDATMGLAGLIAVGAVLPLGALSAERLARRLRYAAGTARRIANGDLDARIGAGDRPGDEIAEISTAMDSMAASLQQRLRSEQQFTADVAHELRTPLMGLVTSAELLPEGEAADYVRDRVRVLRTLIEELLEISRLDAGVEQADLAPCPLGPLVEDCVRRTGLEAEVQVADGAVVDTDPRRLDRIVANLVANAHRHGRPPVEVRVSGAVVTVRDRGPGFPDALLADGPQRFRTGARERGRGHGLGLTIALGQAHVIGAGLDFANAADGGAIATVRLPEHPLT
ncbi:sensor histidine kinase [Streptomyces yunnanensis]|uniref:histidine kinase n=1 Tax=Streptomyces yunnanensis TaxID=156453 RepID=A0A9X8N9Q4_9ACTN|nr:HAMP domain-containing sensor histidine kinase [Streptomyces yunnanensis]SHN34914.1 Signal transduction histidine kinase [Streptomyces yunnanensis]